MKLPLALALVCLVAGCGGAADVIVIVGGGEPDAGRLGALAQDAGAAMVEADPPSPDASLAADSGAAVDAAEAGPFDADPPDASQVLDANGAAGEDASDAADACVPLLACPDNSCLSVADGCGGTVWCGECPPVEICMQCGGHPYATCGAGCG